VPLADTLWGLVRKSFRMYKTRLKMRIDQTGGRENNGHGFYPSRFRPIAFCVFFCVNCV
jgi:hypothetical protein